MFNRKGLVIVSLVLAVLLMFAGAITCAPKPKATPPPPSPPAPAAFSIAKLTISPPEIKPGEKVTITIEVSNTGGSEGTYTAELKVNDVIEATQKITLASKTSQLVSFTVAKATPGTYRVAFDGLKGQFIVATPAPVVRSVVWNNDVATRLLAKAIGLPGATARFLPGNKVVLEYIPMLTLTLPVDVSGGKLYFTAGVPKWVYNDLGAIHPYTKYDAGKLYLTALPPWFDPKKEIAPDVDRLPFIESITTRDGEATITYRWP